MVYESGNQTIALYGFLRPDARVRLTVGWEANLDEDEQHLPFEAGADGVLTGDYLTTDGQSLADDVESIERAGLVPNVEVNEFDPAEVIDRHDDDVAVDTAAGTAASRRDAESID